VDTEEVGGGFLKSILYKKRTFILLLIEFRGSRNSNLFWIETIDRFWWVS